MPVSISWNSRRDETPERLERLKKNVEYRCPVLNLFREADVDVEADWKLVSE